MIRKLKVMLLAALAVSALGALGASVAQGHTPAKFTNPSNTNTITTTLTLGKDGTGKTAHQVLDVFNAAKTASVSFTCNEVTGDGNAIGPEPDSVTIKTPLFTGECSVAGQKLVTVHPGLCNLTLSPSGEVEIVNDGATTECVHGKKPILVTTGAFNCTVEVGAQQLKGLVKYHNLKGAETVASGQGETITVEAKELELTYNAFGTGCPFGTTSNGLYTTGNAIISVLLECGPDPLG